jgi:hypothetical protein
MTSQVTSDTQQQQQQQQQQQRGRFGGDEGMIMGMVVASRTRKTGK